jgi:uncharacterized OB-fold protein
MSTAKVSPLATFREHLARGVLGYQVDPSNGNPVFYPRVIGPESGSTDLEWRGSAGLGTVYAVTVISPKDEAPYNVALVDVDEGFRLMSRIDGMPAADVFVGMRVRLQVTMMDDGQTPLPVFHALEA